jgi:predicted alpha/beta-fold hydrolase
MTPMPSSARPDFQPLPLLSNRHVQTLLGHYLPGARLAHPTEERVLRLPDGDALVLHDTTPPGWRPGGRVAVLVHGLIGSHDSPAIRRVAARLLPHAVRVVRLDLRGAGKGMALARQTYHAGRSDDVRAALDAVHGWDPLSPIVLVGISLGGNLVLKMVGEAADRPPPYLERVAAVCPPIDLVRCSRLLLHPRNRPYERFFLDGLLTMAYQRQRCFPDLPPLRFPRRMNCVLFDDLYTAPRNGFADALDYYRRASAMPHIARIAVPTLVLTARDDPVVAAEPFDELAPPPHVLVRVAEYGGHVGFVGWDGAGGVRWAEQLLTEWVVHGRG